MMLMGLGAKCGDTVNFTVEGPDEDAAAAAVLDFMTNNL
jgi:phosphocarrier protein